MTDTLRDQANKAAVDLVKAEKPQSFTVGGSLDVGTRTATGGITYNHSWKNGWGATAYAKAWWNNAAVIPSDKFGAVIGIEGVKKF
jgi:hypothetical protein